MERAHLPMTHAMDSLRHLKHLKYMAISTEHCFGAFDYLGFWESVTQLSQLECIRTTRNMIGNMDYIQLIKEGRPDLNITIDKSFTRFDHYISSSDLYVSHPSPKFTAMINSDFEGGL